MVEKNMVIQWWNLKKLMISPSSESLFFYKGLSLKRFFPRIIPEFPHGNLRGPPQGHLKLPRDKALRPY